MLITGKCHCGNIALELDWPGDPPEIPARACGCSFCVKHGGVWTSNPRSTLSVVVTDPAQVSKYAHGTRTATFHVCARCGAVPLVTSEIGDRIYAVVNVNALEGLDESWLQRAAVSFEGEDVDSRLTRRQRNWIGQVRFANQPSSAAPPGWHTVTPRIVARDARGLVRFLASAFGARGEYDDARPSVVTLGDSIVMISDAGARPPAPAFLYVYVADTDSTYRRAVDAGARSLEAPMETPYGDRRAMVEDPWGNTWQIATRGHTRNAG